MEHKFLLEKLHKAQSYGNLNEIVSAELGLAKYHYENAEYQKAKIIYLSVLKKKPKYPNLNYYLALIELELNNFRNASKYLKNEILVNPSNEYAVSLLEKLKIHSNTPFFTVFLILINSFFFFFFNFNLTFHDAVRYGVSLRNISIFSAITSVFVHINWLHFSLNMIILLFFGLLLEKKIGSFQFLFIYMIGGILGNSFEALITQGAIVVGASAGLFAILGAIMMREPLLKIKLFFVFDMPIILLLSSFFFLSFFTDKILSNQILSGNISHFVGLFLGIFITAILYKQSTHIFYNWIFMISGFYMIEKSLMILWDFGIQHETILYMFIIFFAVLVIMYSYYHLKYYEEGLIK